MQPDLAQEPTLRADIMAVADLIELMVDKEREFTPDGLRFIASTLHQLATNASILELAHSSAHRRLTAANARIAALTIPDYLKQTRMNIAIREGRAAGTIIDLREVFIREQSDTTARAEHVIGEAEEFTGETA